MRFVVLLLLLAGGLYAMSWWDQREKATNLAASEGRLVVGMTKGQVSQVMGDPQSVAASSSFFGETERYVFRDGPIVTFKNGRVALIEEPERRTAQEDVGSWVGGQQFKDPGIVAKKRATTAKPAMNATEREVREKWGWPKHGTALSR